MHGMSKSYDKWMTRVLAVIVIVVAGSLALPSRPPRFGFQEVAALASVLAGIVLLVRGRL
jgi:hypothetical protein